MLLFGLGAEHNFNDLTLRDPFTDMVSIAHRRRRFRLAISRNWLPADPKSHPCLHFRIYKDDD